MKKTLVFILAYATTLMVAFAQQSGSWDFAAGVHSYYLPAPDFKAQNVQPALMAGYAHSFNAQQSFGLGIRLGYARNKYQGDALYMQALIEFAPVVGKYFQPGIALGAGYQFSFYSSPQLNWENNQWVKGRSYKGVVQVPLQLSLAYRSFDLPQGQLRPYVAYHVNALFRYSPDLTPLPASNFLVGLKYSPKK